MSNGEIIPPTPNTYQQYNQAPPPPKNHTGAIIAVIVVAVVIIATFGYLVLYQKPADPKEYSGTITVSIHNSYPDTRSYSLFVDGDIKADASIGPGEVDSYTITVTWEEYQELTDGSYECSIILNSPPYAYIESAQLEDEQSKSINFTIQP